MQNPSGTERPGEIEARTALFAKVYAHMGYFALNVGAHELAIGLSPLRKFAKDAKLQLISANVRDSKSGEAAFAPYVVRQVGPLKVGIFGLTAQPLDLDKLVIQQGLQLQDPVAAARQVVPELRKNGVDVVVLLSQLRRTDIEAITNQVPGIDLVLGSMDAELTMQPVTVGKQTLFVDAFTKGKYLTEVAISVRGNRTRLYPARLREALMAERSEAANQVQMLASQLESAAAPNSPLRLTEETRKIMESQLTAARARQQRLTMQMESTDQQLPPDATTLDVQAGALAQDVKDDPTVDTWVKKHQQKFPKLGGH